MVGTKITRQRMENQIVSTKIARPRVEQYTNNSLKGWMGGELNGQHENNPPQGMDDTKIARQRDRRIGQLNGRHENDSPKGWTAQK